MLFKEYKKECYYWELVQINKKIIIVLILNFYSQNIKTKAILIFSELYFYYVLSANKQPYKLEEFNKLDLYSMKICLITVFISIFIYR